jgi:hypothetical protein
MPQTKKIKVKVVVFDGEGVEKQSYILPVDGLHITDEMTRMEPMRWMTMDAVDAVRQRYVDLMPIYGGDKLSPGGEYHG